MVVEVLAWVFTGLLLVMVVVSALAGRGVIPLNHLVGIRIPPVERSDAAWRAGHSAAVVPAVIAFVVAAIFSVLGLFVFALYWGAVVAFVGGVVWVLVAATAGARAS